MATSSDSLAVERDAAAACRAYHEATRAALPLEGRRRDLAEFATEFYERRLGIAGDAETRGVLDTIANPDTLLIEMAHDGQLPHLGIVRLVLKAHDIARLDGRAVTLYLVGNHYTAAMRPDNIRFGVPLMGESPDALKHPPKLRIGKAHAHTPFRWLPPPSAHDLEALRNQVADYVTNNLAHEQKLGTLVAPDATDKTRARLDEMFGLLALAAREVQNFGDWLIRVQHDLFHRMLGAEANRILFLPMADLTTLVRDELTVVAERAEEVSVIKATVSARQLARGEEPYQRLGEASAFWVYCPTCFRRIRHAWRPGTALDFACPACKGRQFLEGEEVWRWLMPDIVAYEVALFRVGIDGWVVGSRAAYHPAIERTYARLFKTEMPPTSFLTSVPVFRGIGDPREGYGKTRLLRALLEKEPSALAADLRAPWREDPKLRSDVLDSP